MIRFSMYSGEEIEMDDHLSDFDVSGKAMHTLVSDSVELKGESQKDQNYVRSNHCANNKKTLAAEEKEEDKHKSSDDETFMSSLALIEDSIEPYIVQNTNKPIPILQNRFHSNSANANDASFEELKMTRNTIPQSPHMSNQRIFYSEKAPSRPAGNHSVTSFTPFKQGCPMRNNHDLHWYSDPPPPPPPFPSG